MFRACRNFNNNGSCVEYCPSLVKYENLNYRSNPYGRLSFHHICVKKCPDRFFVESEHCVTKCSSPDFVIINNICTPCSSNVCPRICREKDVKLRKNIPFLYRDMLNRLENCTAYDGNIIINMLSILGDKFHKIDKATQGVRFEDLRKLRNLREVYGSVHVITHGYAPWLKSLTFLYNLTTINGERMIKQNQRGLYVVGNHFLLFLGLKNLKKIKKGRMTIFMNKNLCFTDKLTNLTVESQYQKLVTENGKRCKKLQCDKECNPAYGCWGPSQTLCSVCRHYWIPSPSMCVSRCEENIFGYFTPSSQKSVGDFNPISEQKPESNVTCTSCHPECVRNFNTCSGPKPNQCNFGCQNFKFVNDCVRVCPPRFFTDQNRQCQRCHKSCSDISGLEDDLDSLLASSSVCSGPQNVLGEGGCRRCQHVILSRIMGGKPTLMCTTDVECPDGQYKFLVYLSTNNSLRLLPSHISSVEELVVPLRHWMQLQTNLVSLEGRRSVCLPCHPLCSRCQDGLARHCSSCLHFQLTSGTCVDHCLNNQFIMNETSSSNNSSLVTQYKCLPCHEECDGGCNGTSSQNCFKCRNVKIFLNETNDQFYCNSTCGELQEEFYDSEIVCFTETRLAAVAGNYLTVYFVIGAAAVFVVLTVASIVSCTRAKCHKKHTEMKYLDEFYRLDKENGNGSGGTQPNMAKLLLITEYQLSRADIIGSGAFGVVHRGVWRPDIEKLLADACSNPALRQYLGRFSTPHRSLEVSVAIKLLTDISDHTNNKQLLEEAKVMASVDHPCCLRVLAVCLTAQPQLVTQFMPLGCLLNFCQRHSSLLGGQTLLNWAGQIASGMRYLEGRAIVHCDLAARNVLVQSPSQVKITDFGLAKVLDQSQQKFQSKGGKMPIKWLAIECIKNRLFSSKSDVWSFGVTLWEIFTFGVKPYSAVPAIEMLRYLDNGQRLSQPNICSIDVYALMIQCWLVDPEERPSFSELNDIFSKMCEEPSKYLMIKPQIQSDSFLENLTTDNDIIEKYDEFLQALVTNGNGSSSGSGSLASRNNRRYDDKNTANSVSAIGNRRRQRVGRRSSSDRLGIRSRRTTDKSVSMDTEYTSVVFNTSPHYHNQSLLGTTDVNNDSTSTSANPTGATVGSTGTKYVNSNYLYLLNMGPRLDDENARADISEDGYLIPMNVAANEPNSNTIPANQPTRLGAIPELSMPPTYTCASQPEKEILISHESCL